MSDLTSAISGGDLLSSLAGVAVDAVVGRLARSDKSVSTYAGLKAAVEAVNPEQSAIIKVTENITWPPYTAGAEYVLILYPLYAFNIPPALGGGRGGVPYRKVTKIVPEGVPPYVHLKKRRCRSGVPPMEKVPVW